MSEEIRHASTTAVTTERAHRKDKWLIVLIIVAGLALRLAVSYFCFGTNDLIILYENGATTYLDGLVDAYRKMQAVNHPPIAACWPALAYWLTIPDPRWFPFVF